MTPPTSRIGRILRVVPLVAVLSLTLVCEAAAQSRPRAAATLTILQAGVSRITAAGQRTPATDGMDLALGDRVVTGGSGLALVTFLDGSSVTVQPRSDVLVQQAEVSGRDSARINVVVRAGTAWARVSRLLDPRSRFSLQSNTATAAVHDGLIGAQQLSDGTFECWTQAGDLEVTDAQGRVVATVRPGQMMRLKAGQVTTSPFAITSSTMRIVASPTLLPLVEMPYTPLLAGYVAPGIEVNQVYGSVTRIEADGRRAIEVPAGYPGPYDLFVEAVADGPYEVQVLGFFRGSPTYQVRLTGTAQKGQRLSTSIMQEVPEIGGLGGGADFVHARASSAQMALLRPTRDRPEGKLMLAPGEVEAAGR
jgi:hypothetical protein